MGEFLDLHALLLDDPELLFGLDELIRSGPYSAGYALRLQRDRLAKVFDGMDDAYLKSRMDDWTMSSAASTRSCSLNARR